VDVPETNEGPDDGMEPWPPAREFFETCTVAPDGRVRIVVGKRQP
jgi:hypothetical protein